MPRKRPPKYKIKWIRPLQHEPVNNMKTVSEKFRFEEDLTIEDSTESALHKIYNERMLPVLDIPKNKKTSSRDELMMLLTIASEVEQSLMIQYLYTAYSIKDENDPLRKALISVAIQEMGHFLCVENLLLFTGGLAGLHLSRTDLSSNFPFPFTLQPMSRQVLAKFVTAEAPVPVPEALREEVLKIAQDAENGAHHVIDPVGLLYEKIFWIFQPDDQPVADKNLMQLSPNDHLPVGLHLAQNDWTPAGQINQYEAETATWIDPNQFGNSIITVRHVILQDVKSRQDALTVVNSVAAQGEGANIQTDTDNNLSHFLTFLKNYRLFDTSFPASSNKITLVPENPVTVPAIVNQNAIQITNPYSLLWANLFNTLFSSLLSDIYSSMFYAVNKAEFIQLTHSTMTNLISPIAQVLIRLPLDGNSFSYDQLPLCGPAYEIDKDFTLGVLKAEVDKQNKNFIDHISSLTASIRADTRFAVHQMNDDGASSLLDLGDFYCSKKQELF